MKYQYDGAGWMETQLKYVKPEMKMSEHGRNVANLLGELFCGIYHLRLGALNRAQWDSPNYIGIALRNELATHDYNTLTRLVFLAHKMSLRVEMTGAANKYLRLKFTHSDYKPHPSLEDSIAKFEQEYAV